MAERKEKHDVTQQSEVRQIVEQAVAQALQAQMPQLQSQIVQLEGQLQLVNARRDAVHTMLEFVTGSTANGLGGSGLRSQIEALAASIGPVAKAVPPAVLAFVRRAPARSESRCRPAIPLLQEAMIWSSCPYSAVRFRCAFSVQGCRDYTLSRAFGVLL